MVPDQLTWSPGWTCSNQVSPERTEDVSDKEAKRHSHSLQEANRMLWRGPLGLNNWWSLGLEAPAL